MVDASLVGEAGAAPASLAGWMAGTNDGSCENQRHRFFWMPAGGEREWKSQ